MHGTKVLVAALVTALAGIAFGAEEAPKRDKAKRAERGRKQDKPPIVVALSKLYEARQYTNAAGQKLGYRLMKPADYDPANAARKYPLLICLHGVGGRGEDNARQLACTHAASVIARRDMRASYPCFAMAPQTPTWWGDKMPALGRRPMKVPAKPLPVMSLLLEAVAALRKELPIDPSRLYVTGQSMGGFGTFNALARAPGMFAAAVPVCGRGDPAAARRFARVPIWVFCGDRGRLLPHSRRMVEALQAAGGKPKYTEFPGVGHNSWTRAYATAELWKWMFAQKRPTGPAPSNTAGKPPR